MLPALPQQSIDLKRRGKGCSAVLTSSHYKQSFGEPYTSKNVPKQAKVEKSTEKKKASNLENDDTPCDETPCDETPFDDITFVYTECAGAESGAFECGFFDSE